MFATALCAGVVMVGASVHGLLGVDAELQQRSAVAAQYRTLEQHSVRVIAPYTQDRDCPGDAARQPHHLS